MPTTHVQPGLSSDQRSTIRSTILSTRHTLENELRRQLEKYGIYEDKILPLENLTHLSIEEIHTRRTLDAAIERELESTEGDLERSITNYVREATKTYLNRFVALKTMEVRGLVEETITERPEYGNRSYLHHTVAEIAGELTNSADDGFGVALDLAYQEIGAEIRIIFEESEHTAIDLDAQVRENILDKLEEIDVEAWESDEVLGWVYQYFGEGEREEIDQRIDDTNYKVQDTDVATKTQLFTPRYIVEWMIDNSLGRLWLEMHGDDTNIDGDDKCFYLAPLEQSLIDREKKDVSEIKILDPACGSGHMLFYAFDVLYEMYLEKSEVPEAYIPREILSNNLFGIDIDEGATQIAALALYLKAKSHAPQVTIEEMNIASANAVLVNGDKKQEVLQRAESELEKRVLEQVWRSFENIREWGSLVRIEEQIEEIIEEELEEVKSTGQTQFTSDGLAKQSSMVSFSGEDESWEQVKERLLEQVTELAEKALEQNDPLEEMFAGEVEKSVELLDVFVEEYDIVTTNPPYLGSRKTEDTLKEFTKSNYLSYRDLYAAFIQRCTELSAESGYVAMVTPESFMTQSAYQKVREFMLEETQFLEGAHLSGHSFSMKDRPFTIPFVLRNTNPSSDSLSKFYRMTHEQDAYDTHEKKISGLNSLAEIDPNKNQHEDVFIVKQRSFTKIDKMPMAYWFGDEILEIFEEYPQVGEFSEVAVGLQTGDDDKFMRCWWEIDTDHIGDKYTWIINGENDLEYYESPSKVVLWENDGEQIKEYDGSRPQNEDYYRKPGVIYRKFSKLFTAKLHPDNHIFSQTTRFVYTDKPEYDLLLTGYFSSSLIRYVVHGLNPSVHFNQSDAKRIPIDIERLNNKIATLSETAIQMRKEQYSLDETKREFDPDRMFTSPYKILEEEYMYEADISIIHGLIDNIVFDHYDLSDQSVSRIYNEVPKNLANYPHHPEAGELNSTERSYREDITVENAKNITISQIISNISDNNNGDLRDIAEDLQVSPYTIAAVCSEHNLYTQDEKREAAGRLLSCYLGVLFGRWDALEEQIAPVEDGILVFGDQFDNNVTDRIRECIEATFDDVYDQEAEIETLLGKDMTDWLRENFFRYHHCKEYRRRGQRIPIYWHLESDNGAFSCFVYYHEIDENTLPKIRGQYLDPRIVELKSELETLNAQTDEDSPDKELLNRMEKVQNDLDDLKEFRDTIDEMIDHGVTVDVEKGIWENIKEWDQYEVLETGLPKLKSSYSR